MDYDPVKDRLGRFFWATPTRTRAFYRVLDTVFLRSWYVRRALRRHVEACGDRPVRVLDAGTGFGQYAYWLVRSFPNVTVTALDIKDEYLARARAFMAQTPYASRVAFEAADLTQPLAYSDAFDLALSVDVMEHIEDDRAVFRHVLAALKPGGVFIVNTPSDQGGSGVTEEGEESFIGEHVRDGYPLDELVEKLETAGMEVTETAYAYGRAGSAGWRLLVKWPIQMLSASRWLTPLVAAYYLPAGPVGLALNALDVRADNPTGTGLLVTSRRPG
ncbi:class I SAM-dependent methyltransferase [Rubrivirga sp. IMCC45206]|uniref:class I SAM-dependent methyltransferase n=1 Tax=Rubrivirga sp. IMCC45206 TaxID=3391614 RepID=UPI00399031D9